MKKSRKLKKKIARLPTQAKEWFEFEVLRRIKDAKLWIANRTYDKFHVLHLGTKPGFSDSSEILLNANFAVLVHFVERELSAMEIIVRKHDPKKFGTHKGVSKRELGLSYLKFWETVEDCSESHSNEGTREFAKTVRELYIWWKDIKPNKINEAEQQLEKFYENVRKSGRNLFGFRIIKNGIESEKVLRIDEDHEDDEDENGDKIVYTLVSSLTEEEEQLHTELSKKSIQTQEESIQEEQEMLQKLISIRLRMWS